MRNEVFEEILQCVELPLGELLSDGNTYRIAAREFNKINTKHQEELNLFEKFLALTCNQKTVVGGVLFYGSTDIQVMIFPEYRGNHYMSKIHKNGILESECYENQQVTVSKDTIESFNDFCMKHYLLSCADLKISNLAEIYKYFNMFKDCNRFGGFQHYSLEEFIKKFS